MMTSKQTQTRYWASDDSSLWSRSSMLIDKKPDPEEVSKRIYELAKPLARKQRPPIRKIIPEKIVTRPTRIHCKVSKKKPVEIWFCHSQDNVHDKAHHVKPSSGKHLSNEELTLFQNLAVTQKESSQISKKPKSLMATNRLPPYLQFMDLALAVAKDNEGKTLRLSEFAYKVFIAARAASTNNSSRIESSTKPIIYQPFAEVFRPDNPARRIAPSPPAKLRSKYVKPVTLAKVYKATPRIQVLAKPVYRNVYKEHTLWEKIPLTPLDYKATSCIEEFVRPKNALL